MQSGSKKGLAEVEVIAVIALVVEAVEVVLVVVDGVTGDNFVSGVLSVKVTIKSSIPDVELGLETLGQGVVTEGSLVIASVIDVVVEGEDVVKPWVMLVFEGMLVNVLDSGGDDS